MPGKTPLRRKASVPADLGETVRQITSAFVRHVRSATATLRTAQWETLELLEMHGSLSVAELARLRSVKHQSMRLVVAELENTGMLSRDEHPQDARAQVVSISKQARAQLQAARRARAQWIDAQIAARLSPEQQAALAAGMAAMRALLEADTAAL